MILILGSIIVNYLLGQRLASGGNVWLLRLGVGLNLAAIGYFKYANFFMGTLSDLAGKEYTPLRILLPLGISFYTFQQVAYLVDAYRTRTCERHPVHYALFVTFFPQLIAGPIVHHSELIPQLKDAKRFVPNSSAIYTGLTLFLLGLFKKVVVADGFSPYVSAVFNHADAGGTVSFFEAWGAVLSYTLQIYYDFSGYSDMAVGMAAILNIRLPINFFSPYRQTSIIDFWRCWHMTLSRFLKDYVYIPLGGSRVGSLGRRYTNLMITMLVGGLWHGAGWTFVIWGGLHGFYLLVNHSWRRLPFHKPSSFVGRSTAGFLSWGLTFLSVSLAWVFFRAGTLKGASSILKGMGGASGFVLPKQIGDIIPGIQNLPGIQFPGTVPLLGGGTLMGLVEQVAFILLFLGVAVLGRNLYQLSARTRLLLLMLTAAFTIQRVFFSPAPSEFIYFQF
ncbi:MBOAT family protein [Kiritimatiellaeota bacterium B1221]|nr:MBOAT family protein [Kiritimatiellaeota bacterium B1221]